jgi:hypothetical protein
MAGLLVLSIVLTVAWIWNSKRFVKKSARQGPPLVYAERKAIDTSGFTTILPGMEAWPRSSSLAAVREAFRDVGPRNIAQIDRLLATPSISEEKQLLMRLVRASIFQYDSEPKRCSEALEEIRSWLADRDALAQQWLLFSRCLGDAAG